MKLASSFILSSLFVSVLFVLCLCTFCSCLTFQGTMPSYLRDIKGNFDSVPCNADKCLLHGASVSFDHVFVGSELGDSVIRLL